MIKGIHHVTLAVKSIEETLKTYEQLLGLKATEVIPVPDQGIKAAFLPVGKHVEIELIEPTNPEGGVAKFIEKRGEGIHHICLEVDNIDKELKALADKGVEIIDKTPRRGVPGRIAFLHPRAARGILLELVEPYKKPHKK